MRKELNILPGGVVDELDVIVTPHRTLPFLARRYSHSLFESVCHPVWPYMVNPALFVKSTSSAFPSGALYFSA